MGLADQFAKDAGVSSTAPDSSVSSQFATDAASPSVVQSASENSPTFGVLSNLLAGGVRGAGSIGATILAPVDWAANKLGIHNAYVGVPDRRAAMDQALSSLGADTNSTAFKTGKVGTEIAGTAAVGGVLGNAAKSILPTSVAALPAVQKVISGLETGGFKLGGVAPSTILGSGANLSTRAGTGAIVGGLSAGAVDPNEAGAGAAIGGAIPVIGAGIAKGSMAFGNALRGGEVSPEVANLANKAQSYGINIPADRITNSKLLNATASALNYIPFSGRQAVEDGMQSQLNSALTNTFGQSGDNVTSALNQAKNDLGGQFDNFLKSNSINVDPTFLNGLGDVSAQAAKDLTPDQAKIISGYIDDIVGKASNGQIDGQAAYNIKRNLDNLSNSGSPVAFYAKQLKGVLMGGLNSSLAPDQQQAFSTLRQQYGNMKTLLPLMQNGAEGNVSLARLANLKNVNNPDLQDLADISAQFLKGRETPHSGKQSALFGAMGLMNAGAGAGTAVAGPIGGAIGAAGALLGGTVLGKTANSALSSNWARNAVLGNAMPISGLLSDAAIGSAPIMYRGAGLLSAQ